MPVQVDLEKLSRVAESGATYDELAAHLKLTRQEFAAFVAQPEMTELIASARELGNLKLRWKQYTMAMEGDQRMLDLLGRERLGQRGTGADITIGVDVEGARQAIYEKMFGRPGDAGNKQTVQ